MLHYDRIDISKGIDLAKSNNSRECMVCHYWLFNHGFEFQDSVCNGCNNLTMLSVNISNIAITTVKNVDYRSIIHNSISVAINSLKNYVYVCMYKKYCFKFQSTQGSFLFTFFVLVHIKWLIVTIVQTSVSL